MLFRAIDFNHPDVADFDESGTDREGPLSAFDRCDSRQKWCGGDDLKKNILFGRVLVCKNGSVPDGELRESICDQSHAQKKTRPKHIFSIALHIAVFDGKSTDRKRTLSSIDPC